MESHEKNGSHYRRLTAIGHAAGYSKLNPHTVQSWVKAGLLPRVRYERPGFGVRVAVGSNQIEAQFAELCRLRYEEGLRAHVLLALVLWTTGWNVDLRVVRRYLHDFVESLSREADAARRGHFAASAARRRNHPPGWHDGDPVRLALALETLLGILSGDSSAQDDVIPDLAYLERVTGLDHARTDRVDDAAPWLPTGPGLGTARAAEALAVPNIVRAIDGASDAQLMSVRDTALAVYEAFAVVLPMMARGFGPDFAGFRSMTAAMTYPATRIVFVLVGLVVPDAMSAFARALPDDSDLEELARELPLAEAMVAADPDLAERANAMGLAAALRADAASLAPSAKKGEPRATS